MKLKRPPQEYYRHSVFLKVKEDWYGNYGIKDDIRHQKTLLVELTICELFTEKETWRVMVWGNDDMGMEIDYEGSDAESKAKEMFNFVASTPYATRQLLLDSGWLYV